jgi:8-oxo-dGTP diphosphatase
MMPGSLLAFGCCRSMGLAVQVEEQSRSTIYGRVARRQRFGFAFHGSENPMKREYPSAPIVAVGVIIRQDDRIVLTRRGKEPSKGLWTFPGGAIELGETLQEAARREALEETGLDVEIGDVATVLDNVVRDDAGWVQYHYVIVDYFGRPVGGVLQPGTDVSEARWFRLVDLDAVEMTEKAAVIARRLLAHAPQAGTVG